MVTAFAQACDLPQAQLPFQEACRLIMQTVTDPVPIELGAAASEASFTDQAALALAIGEEIEALRDHGAVTAHRAITSTAGTRHFRLLRKSAINQHHHRLDLGHRIGHAVVIHLQTSNDDHALIPLRAQVQRALMTTMSDGVPLAAPRASWLFMPTSRTGQISARNSLPENPAIPRAYGLSR
jgi:hypothetical protein